MRTLWGSTTQPKIAYSYYVHLFSQNTGEMGTSLNGVQPVSDVRTSNTWNVPSELLVGPVTSFDYPGNLQSGTYQVWMGLYDPISGSRLQLADGTDHAVVGTLTIHNNCQAF
jgi:hypothetical protein